MLETILIAIASSLVAGVGGFLVARKINSANYEIYTEQAKARAKAIEHESEILLQSAKVKAKETEIEAKKRFDDEYSRIKGEYDSKLNGVQKKEEQLERRLIKELEEIDSQRKELKATKEEISKSRQTIESLKDQYKQKLDEMLDTLSKSARFTLDEAREYVLKKTEEEQRSQIALIVRKYEQEARDEAKKRANYILAQATTRFAGEFAAERLINVVHISDDELKGRIIGKEGRNIKTLEMLTGVDIIIDDTPNAIILSSFNLYRRAIATRVIELLVQDGRIQPARIEEICEKVKNEFEDKLVEEGENVLLDLGVNGVHPELVKLVGRLKYRASFGQNALGHSLEVAYLAGIMAAEMGGDETLAKRAGILHDIGKALTQEYSGSHVDLGADVCRRYKEHPVVINAIYAHHGHEEARSIECAAVCAADTLSAARPGARREVLESFLKRVGEIEGIALSKQGVRQAYAINAGREIRVIASAELLNDDEAVLLSKEIAGDIQNSVQYPGEIKVSVIRELRAIEYAR